jgi:hypothetical protein
MRAVVIFLVVAGLGFLYWRQRQSDTSSNTAKPVATQAAQTEARPAPLMRAPLGHASKYNFMKRDLDRARQVRDQSQRRLREAQDPAP